MHTVVVVFLIVFYLYVVRFHNKYIWRLAVTECKTYGIVLYTRMKLWTAVVTRCIITLCQKETKANAGKQNTCLSCLMCMYVLSDRPSRSMHGIGL